jgi:hypothetical protein
MMQTDVLSAHVNVSGFAIAPQRTRLKGFFCVPTSSSGTVNLWDSKVAPQTGTYTRSGTTVTVSITSHGYTTGQSVGLAFGAGTGGTATNGNYIVTVSDANTFTVTDINSGTITGTGTAAAATRWLTSFDTTASVAAVISVFIPGEGMVVYNQIYAQLTNVTGITVFYG